MNPIHINHSRVSNYPAVELDMTDFMEYLSEEYLHGKVDVKDESVQTNRKQIDCKTEHCTDLENSSSISVSKLE